MNKLSWGYATIPEKYKENFDVQYRAKALRLELLAAVGKIT
jgi:hypothetical protein